MELLSGGAVLCAAWAVVASIRITIYLHKRGVAVRFLWFRWMILKYLHEYARITREETGRVGPLFYHYVVPLNMALALVIVLAVASWG